MQHVVFVKFGSDVDFYQYTDMVCSLVPEQLLALTLKRLCRTRRRAHKVYLGLQTSSNGRPHVVD